MQFTELENKQARHFLERAYNQMSWTRVFEGSIVKCEKCLNTIRESVLRRNSDMNMKIPKGKAPRLSFLKGTLYWSVKMEIEAKELANDPNWCCDHPSETYFVTAILMGVKELMDNEKKAEFCRQVRSKCGRRKEQTVRDKTRNK